LLSTIPYVIKSKWFLFYNLRYVKGYQSKLVGISINHLANTEI
jgi:hypothetical protein